VFTVEESDQIIELADRAENGDQAAVTELTAIYDKCLPDWWKHVADSAVRAQQAWVTLAAGETRLLSQGAIERMLRAMQESLAGPNPTALEQLLIDRILACWLQVQHADTRYVERAMYSERLSFQESEFLQRRQDRTQLRYLQAIKTLAQVRRLAAPVLQVNVAKSQLNVATAAAPKD
jgi:hypothetical protein